MNSESRNTPDHFHAEARLFPLPNLVFFPHNIQPLHIFESRYREMMKDALEGDQLIALATLEPGYETDYYSRPPVAPVACVGRIVNFEQNDDDTYNLLLIGLHRVRIGQEITPVRSFRRARVSILEEEAVPARDAKAQQLGAALVKQLAAMVPALSPLSVQYRQEKLSLGALTDVLAFHLPLPTRVKLDLLSETDPLQRATVLLNAMPKSAPPVGNRSFPPGFGHN